jgi:hypothetical protein
VIGTAVAAEDILQDVSALHLLIERRGVRDRCGGGS